MSLNKIKTIFNKEKAKNNCFIIAEIGQNHNGSIKAAKNYINHAAKCGFDAVKFQYHIAEEESTYDEVFRSPILGYKTRIDYWKKTSFNLKQWKQLKRYAEKKKLVFFASFFSLKAYQNLKKINIKLFKIASGEFLNDQLIKKLDKSDYYIASTGLSTVDSIQKFIKKNKFKKLAILQCTSRYPTPIDQSGLNLIKQFKKKFNCVIGFSDHSGDKEIAKASIALGANILEFHLKDKKKIISPDNLVSLNIKEAKEIINYKNFFYNIKNSSFSKKKLPKDILKNLFHFTKSISLNRDIKKNEKIYLKDIKFKKPGTGFKSNMIRKIIGKKAKKNLSKFRILKKGDF